jgi:putative ABC transport system permease protein
MNFLLRMAWRDSRRSRQRLLLFMSAIVLGIAALVGLNSFGDNLARSIDAQARELLGADLVLSYAKTIDKPTEAYLKSIGKSRTYEVSFASMTLFPRTGGIRLAQVKGLDGPFPYYGEWDVQPRSAIEQFRQASGADGRVALVDDALLIQFGAKPGDSVRLGSQAYYIAGRVLKTPGQSAVATSVAPTVFVSAKSLNSTGLLARGSRVQYKYYYQFVAGQDVDKFVKVNEKRFDKAGINQDTVQERKEQTGRAFSDLTKFLNLVAFVALLLGCVGVASAVHLYVKEKVASVAVLRTLGASGRQAFLIFLIQTALMGFIGAVIGAVAGSLVQVLLPRVFAGFLPVTVETAISWSAVAQGVGVGLLVSVLFALLPLLMIRNVSPLRTLRASYEDDTAGRDPFRFGVYALIVLFIMAFSYWQTRDWMVALGFTGGLLVAFGLLTGLGLLLINAVRRFFPRSWSFVWRQSLASLYRPNNQTVILITSIGLGAFLIATLTLTQNLLLDRVAFSGDGSSGGKRPNMVLFDIQNEQRAGVRALAAQYKLPVVQEVPVVTMRLSTINGRTVEAIQADTSAKIPEWVLTREYRVTYRDTLIDSEKLATGKIMATVDGTPRISVEKGYLERMKLKLGDTLTFNVQGALIPTIVGGTREVDWNRVQSNFLVVFPNGVLEQAPQFAVLMTRVGDTQQSVAFQRDLVARFPNVSAIDLGLILRTVDEILDKVSFVIRFMALFSILTGLLVLASSVIISRYQRMQESVLLRTLGASRAQILRIQAIEYLMLGLLAALSGIVLALGATWALAYFVFETPFTPNLWPLAAVAGVVTLLTLLIGLLNSRAVLTRPPLEVLRAEV